MAPNPGTSGARAATIAAVLELVAVKGGQEYWLRTDNPGGRVNPGLDVDGTIITGL